MNYNKVILAGRLTRDPELTYTTSKTPVANFGMATNRKWKGQDGNSKEETCYVDLTAFGRQAETITKYVKKGSPLLVEGRLTFESWTAQDGTKRNRLKVTVEGFQFISDGQKAPEKPADVPDDDIPF